MFSVITADNQQYGWYVNDKKPGESVAEHQFQTFKPLKNVQELFANDQELNSIRTKFSNLPINHGNTCTWRGDMAQFIYDNL